jgi:protocatechuate 3,4-dioxygenase alpha subunit
MHKQTPSQTVGPFFEDGLFPSGAENVLINEQTRGRPVVVEGFVLDGDGEPVPDALVEIWQADAQGIFNHPADPRHAAADPHFRGFGRSQTPGGRYHFQTVKPGPVPWDEQQEQAPHLLVRLFARGMLTHATTRLYFSDEADNAHDPVLQSVDPGRRQALIAMLDPHKLPPTYRLDFQLQGAEETPFFDP